MEDKSHQLIGHRVSISMGADGVYVGEILELTGSPWTGRVRITGVTSPARHFENGIVCRRGYRPGEFVTAPSKAISPAKDCGHPSYLEALQAQLGLVMGSHSGYMTSTHPWVPEALARGLRAAMIAEHRRLETGNWYLASVETELSVG
jgi:hypothetical protein